MLYVIVIYTPTKDEASSLSRVGVLNEGNIIQGTGIESHELNNML